MIQIPFLDRGISFYDEGSILAIADGLRHGGVMYRDHVTPTAPLTYELVRVLFNLFGPSLLVARLFQAVVFTLCTVLVYGILRQFMGLSGALLGALACLPVKTLGFPLWTIVNYSQLALLFCLAAVLLTLRFLCTRRLWWLAAAGAGVGVTLITKQNLGGLLGLTLAGTVALDALREPERPGTRLRRMIGAGIVMLAGALPPLVATLAYYAAAGALGDLVHRAIFGLAYLTKPYNLPFPLVYGAMRPSEVIFSYFPSAVAQMVWQGRLDLYESPHLYLVLANGVKVFYLAPVLALLLGVAALVRSSGAARSDWSALLLMVLFAATTYSSMLYRSDWTHLMNVFPPQLLLGCIVLQRWTRSTRAVWLGPALCGMWLGVGGLGAYAVFAGYSAPVDTPRGRLFARPDEAEDARGVLAYLAAQPSDAHILFLRADPLYYFLSGRRMPGSFDLVMPGIVGPGDDQRIARSLTQADQVIYNPKSFLTVPVPITDYAPETAHALATDFRIAKVLNPTAVVLEPRLSGGLNEITATDLWKDFDDFSHLTTNDHGRIADPQGALERTSWMVNRVVAAKITEPNRWVCFGLQHTAAAGEAVVATAMLSPICWVQVKGDPDYDPQLVGARFKITVAANAAPPTNVYEKDQMLGETGAAVRVPLDPFAGQVLDIQFCAALPEGVGSAPAHTIAGWAEPRIVRSFGKAQVQEGSREFPAATAIAP